MSGYDDDLQEFELKHGFYAEPLSEVALQRIRQRTQAQWRSVIREKARLPRIAAIAALLVIVIGVGWLAVGSRNFSAAGPTLGRLDRTGNAGVVEELSFGRHRAVLVGTDLHAGQSLLARGDSLILLASGGTLRLSSGTALKIVSDHHVRLIDGIVYLDFPPTLVQGERFVVETLAGMFEHSGTQFEIAVQQDRSRLRVREGLVKWRSAGASEITKAGAEMTVERNGVITRQAIVTTGRDWAWAEALAPDYSIDDQPMLGFLEWVARETGRKLTFADSAARNQVTGITLHGSVQGMTIMEALSLVMQTTPLRFDLAEDQIRVSSKGETGATSK